MDAYGYGLWVLVVTNSLQWPTLVTALMFPVLVIAYRRLTSSEERDVRRQFGADWDAYAAHRPQMDARVEALLAAETLEEPQIYAAAGLAHVHAEAAGS